MRQFLPLLGLLSLPLLSTAQTLPPSPSFYVGAQASWLTVRPFKSTTGIPQLLGPSLTVGTQLTPRWGLQLSAAYVSRGGGYDDSYYNSGLGVTQRYLLDYQDRIFTFPLLARYTLTPPRRPLQLALLGGVTYLRATYTSTSQYFRDGQLAQEVHDHNVVNQPNLTLGPSLRYAVTGKLALTAEALANWNLNYTYPYLYGDHFFTNLRAGVQVAFGRPG